MFCRLPLPGDNLKIMLLALSASMTACGVPGDVIPFWAYYGGNVMQNIQDISVVELYYNELDADKTVSPAQRPVAHPSMLCSVLSACSPVCD